MCVYKLKPVFKSYIWGGERLKKEYNKSSELETIAESWELSSVSGSETLTHENKKIPGLDVNFPVMIKFIDAKESLSVQVHPDADFSGLLEGQNGKNELWYVLEAAPEAYIYYGLKSELTKREFLESIENSSLEKFLNRIPVQKGDYFYIPSGTIHAIGNGCLIAEIQQNSDTTYRIYDYGRLDKNGEPRTLHIDQAIEAADLSAVKIPSNIDILVETDDFTVSRLRVFDQYLNDSVPDAYISLLVTDGIGRIQIPETEFEIKKGDSLLIPPGTEWYSLTGALEVLSTIIPEERTEK